jgi:hypothetical protein
LHNCLVKITKDGLDGNLGSGNVFVMKQLIIHHCIVPRNDVFALSRASVLNAGYDSPEHRCARSPSLQLRWKEGIG